jgi:hypothetical protein
VRGRARSPAAKLFMEEIMVHPWEPAGLPA